MRHKNTQTTMKYYVGQNAKQTAGIVWGVYNSLPPAGAIFGANEKNAADKSS